MSTRESTMTPEQRVAAALEGIEVVLNELLGRVPSPPRARDLPEPGVDANQAFMSGQFKRRAGNVTPTPAPGQFRIGSPPPGTQLDPWVRRDVPMIDDGENRQWPGP